MNVVRNSVKNGLIAAVAALVVICSAQVSLAGYSSILSNNVGQVSASLGSGASGSYTNKATTLYPVVNPNAGVTTVGTWLAQTNRPSGIATTNYSTVGVSNLFGYKVVAKSYTAAGVTADPSIEFSKKLLNDGYILVPNPCGSGYTIASGEEMINGQRNLVVLGNGTGGAAVWFRGYFFPNGPPSDRDTLITTGDKLFDVVVQGPFDFGDITSSDRCNALKIPIAYTGPNLYLVSDGATVSTTDLAIVNCPGNLTMCGTPAYPANITTTGGCGGATISFNPPNASSLPFGTSTVIATATDAAGNVSPPCTFTVTRPFLTINGFYPPLVSYTTPGTCTAPAEKANSGSRIVIKFDLLSCNSPYLSPTAPTITVKKVTDTSNCGVTTVVIPPSAMQAVANQWHFNWNTVKGTDVGVYRIEVNLQDGNPNPPYNYLLLQ